MSLLYVSNERGAEVVRDWVHGPPELVIEIAPPSTRKRDETIKRGIQQIWLDAPAGCEWSLRTISRHRSLPPG
jgi:Uma2 family endonuclease